MIFGCNEISGPLPEPPASSAVIAKASPSIQVDSIRTSEDSVNSKVIIEKVGTVTLIATFQTKEP